MIPISASSVLPNVGSPRIVMARGSFVLFPTTHGLMGFRNQVCGTTTYIHSSNSLLTISMATNTALARKRRTGFQIQARSLRPRTMKAFNLVPRSPLWYEIVVLQTLPAHFIFVIFGE